MDAERTTPARLKRSQRNQIVTNYPLTGVKYLIGQKRRKGKKLSKIKNV